MVVVGELVVRIGIVDHRRARPDCFLDVQHMRQDFIIDTDPGDRLKGDALAVGNHGDNRFADIPDLAFRDQRFVVDAEIEQTQQRIEIVRHVTALHDTPHAFHAFGLRGVDKTDAGVVVGTAHAFHMQQPLEQMIIKERRTPGDVTERILALGRLADLIEVVIPLVGEQILAKLNHDWPPDPKRREPPDAAASRIAVMIGS